MNQLVNDVIGAVKLYKCSGSLWQYKDNIPFEVKRFIAYLHEATIEDVNNISKDYVNLPANQFNREYCETLSITS